MTRVIPPSWAQAIDDYSMAQRVAGKAPSTIKLRREQLSLLARHTDRGPWEVQLDDLIGWLGARDWSQERRRSMRTTLRGFYRWGVASDLLSHNPADGLPVIQATSPNPRPTPDLVYRRATHDADTRSRLMIRLAVECGMRRAEVAQVHTRDLERDLGGWSLVVHGKGNKIRLIPLPASVATELRGLPVGYAFPGQDGGHLSPRWVGRLIRDLLGDGYTMHGLRHRFATQAYQCDRDVFTLQAMLGHASPETTRRYVQVPSDAMRRMVEQVSQQNGAA
jgi:integrase/recombinase XerC